MCSQFIDTRQSESNRITCIPPLLFEEPAMSDKAAVATDRFGNALDPIVNYARGSILRGTDEEVARMLRARQLVAERVRRFGQEQVYDLSGMNRGGGVTAEDTAHLTSHVPFFERF